MRGIYRTLYFLPVVTMPAAVALVWRMLYNGDFGVINELLGLVGIEGTTGSPTRPRRCIAIAVVGIWARPRHHIVIFLAGIQGIPDDSRRRPPSTAPGPSASSSRSRSRC